MLKLSKEEFEKNKKQMREKGDSFDGIREVMREYVFKTFENIMIDYINKHTTINIDGFVYDKLDFTYNNLVYIFSDYHSDISLQIEKRKISDIVIDTNKNKQQIILLLVSGDEIIINVIN